MDDSGRRRLPAHERKDQILACATRMFAEQGYRATTTAQLAVAIGVTEPVLYRHFASKQALYIACLEYHWQTLRTSLDVEAARTSQALVVQQMVGRLIRADGDEGRMGSLWLDSLAEAAQDEQIRVSIRDHLRGVHVYLAGVVQSGQAAGELAGGLTPGLEAWYFVGLALLGTAGSRLDDAFDGVGERLASDHRKRLSGD